MIFADFNLHAIVSIPHIYDNKKLKYIIDNSYYQIHNFEPYVPRKCGISRVTRSSRGESLTRA